MNLFELKATVAAFHQKETDELIQNSVDLFLVAANQTRRALEEMHDFEYCRCTATVDIDGVTGGDLADAVISPADTFDGVKMVTGVGAARENGEILPVDFSGVGTAIARERAELELGDIMWPVNRYPSDAQFLNRVGEATIVQRGSVLYRSPRVIATSETPFTAYLECVGWLKKYTVAHTVDESAEPQDFILAQGGEYMQWDIIIKLNYLFQTFVPRQEGNVGSPEALRQEALRKLLLWDDYLIEAGTTGSK